MFERESQRNSARQRILNAVFRLVEQGGVEEASLRKVATESGINIGSVRHYFGSHEALLTAAAEELGNRLESRLLAAGTRPEDPAAVAAHQRLLERVAQVLVPNEQEARCEQVVLVEFITEARNRPELRALAERTGHTIRAVLRRSLERAHVADLDMETERLLALIGGLAFGRVYSHVSDETLCVQDILRHHLAALMPE